MTLLGNQMDNEETNEEIKDDSITETLDFDHPSFVFQPKEQHDWRQQGFFLVCKSCELQHSVYIGSEKLLVGLDNEGKPILKKQERL